MFVSSTFHFFMNYLDYFWIFKSNFSKNFQIIQIKILKDSIFLFLIPESGCPQVSSSFISCDLDTFLSLYSPFSYGPQALSDRIR